jgi:glycosyltransferase involved in cell wall biosynthesis
VTGHGRLRVLARERPGDYAALIRRLDAEAGPPPGGEFRAAVDARSAAARAAGLARAALVGPCLMMGGAEAHGAMLLGAAMPGVAWVGAAATHGEGATDPRRVAEYRALAPLGLGPADARHLAARCDVLVVWAVPEAGPWADLASPRPRVVCVVHAPAEAPWGRDVYAAMRGVDRWVLVSELCRGAVPAGAAGSATAILNAADPRHAAPGPGRSRGETRARWGVPPGAFVAGALQRMSAEKGCDALMRLAAAAPRWLRVVAVGDGAERGRMRAEASWRGLPIALPGADDDPGAALAAFDCLLALSDYESFGLSIAEAWLAGVPVISTPVGAAALHPGLTREVGPAPSGAEVLSAIEADRADPCGTAARVARARGFAARELAPARFAAEWGRLIREEAAAGRRPPPRPSPRRLPDAELKRLLAAVAACSSRGPELPASAAGGCCGGGPTRWACAAGLGSTPGAPTLDDCLGCRAGAWGRPAAAGLKLLRPAGSVTSLSQR